MEEVIVMLICECIFGCFVLIEVFGLMIIWWDQLENLVGLLFDVFVGNVDNQVVFVEVLCIVIQDFDFVDELGGDLEESENFDDEDEGVDCEQCIGEDEQFDGDDGGDLDMFDVFGMVADEDEIMADIDDFDICVEVMDDDGVVQIMMCLNWCLFDDMNVKVYKVFMCEFDEVVYVMDMCEMEELECLC